MRLLTPDCRTPSALAAALKLRYSATTSAWTTWRPSGSSPALQRGGSGMTGTAVSGEVRRRLATTKHLIQPAIAGLVPRLSRFKFGERRARPGDARHGEMAL